MGSDSAVRGWGQDTLRVFLLSNAVYDWPWPCCPRCAVSPCRYTSGDVRLWDTLHWDASASYLKTSSSLGASWETRPAVSHVQVNGTVAAAAFHLGEGVQVLTAASGSTAGSRLGVGKLTCGPQWLLKLDRGVPDQQQMDRVFLVTHHIRQYERKTYYGICRKHCVLEAAWFLALYSNEEPKSIWNLFEKQCLFLINCCFWINCLF